MAMKRRTLVRRKKASRFVRGGEFLLALSVLASTALGFSSFLIGPSSAEVGPFSATVGEIAYATTIGFSDIGLSFDEGTPDGPSFVYASSSSGSFSGPPTFEVEGKIERAKLSSLAFYDDVMLKVSFFLEGTDALNANFVTMMTVSLSAYGVYSFECEGERNLSIQGATTAFLLPVKSRSDRSLWTLLELDAVHSFETHSPVVFSFGLEPASLDAEKLAGARYAITFSLMRESQ